MSIKRVFAVSLGILSFGATLSSSTPAEASRQWVDCSVASVLLRSDAMSIRCSVNVGDSPWFNLNATAPDVFFNRILNQANAALIAGKPIKILYETADSNRQILGIDVFK